MPGTVTPEPTRTQRWGPTGLAMQNTGKHWQTVLYTQFLCIAEEEWNEKSYSSLTLFGWLYVAMDGWHRLCLYGFNALLFKFKPKTIIFIDIAKWKDHRHWVKAYERWMVCQGWRSVLALSPGADHTSDASDPNHASHANHANQCDHNLSLTSQMQISWYFLNNIYKKSCKECKESYSASRAVNRANSSEHIGNNWHINDDNRDNRCVTLMCAYITHCLQLLSNALHWFQWFQYIGSNLFIKSQIVENVRWIRSGRLHSTPNMPTTWPQYRTQYLTIPQWLQSPSIPHNDLLWRNDWCARFGSFGRAFPLWQL